jgi:L-rhamnose isomerase
VLVKAIGCEVSARSYVGEYTNTTNEAELGQSMSASEFSHPIQIVGSCIARENTSEFSAWQDHCDASMDVGAFIDCDLADLNACTLFRTLCSLGM